MSNQQDIQSAIQYFQSGNIKQAKIILDKYIISYPDDVNANLLSAAISAENLDYVEVVNRCKKVLSIEPNNIRASYNAAVASEKLKNHRDVIIFTSKIIQYDNANLQAKMLLISALYDSGEHVKSINEAKTTALENIYNVDVIENIYKLYKAKSNIALVEKLLGDLLKADAKNIALLSSMVSLSVDKNDYVNAKLYTDKLISIDSDNVNTVNSVMSSLTAQRKILDCISYFEKLTNKELVLSVPKISMMLAECYMDVSENNKALIILNNNISSNINPAECFHNVGIIEERLGNADAAIKSYQRAISLSPNSFSSYYNLAFCLDTIGKKQQLISVLNKCWDISHSAKLKQAYIKLLSTASVSQIDKRTEDRLLEIISDKETNAHEISYLFSEIIKDRSPVLNALIKYANANDYENFLNIFTNNFHEIVSYKALKLYFINLSIITFEFECFAKMLRQALLLHFTQNKNIPQDCYELCSALAICCYIDGYVFTVTNDEKSIVSGLIENLPDHSGSLENCISVIAMYSPLFDLYKNNTIKINSDTYDGVFKSLLKLQLDDNILEEVIYDSIETSPEISDATSLTVQKQYEGNPYPVWQKLDVRQPGSILNILQSITGHQGSVIPQTDQPDILIAGCGTGSHVIQTAMRIQHNSLTALDLSRRSLSFAKRKSIEYGLEHIDFRHMDILNVSNIAKKFDLIESVGVLHHMQTPLTGLKRLVNILKPSGLMNIGLYSKLGRRNIISLKAKYDDQDRYVSDDEIRQLRIDIINSNDNDVVNNLISFTDFFSLHECRDLLFHENENNYNMQELASLIEDAGLEFIGFDIQDSSILTSFRKMFPEPNAQSIMSNWRLYEERYPDTFSGMYVFWCRKT